MMRRSAQRVVAPDDRLADAARAPGARDPVPAVAGQQRHGVHDDEALDALGVALGPHEADGAPVVDDEADAVDLDEVEERRRRSRA